MVDKEQRRPGIARGRTRVMGETYYDETARFKAVAKARAWTAREAARLDTTPAASIPRSWRNVSSRLIQVGAKLADNVLPLSIWEVLAWLSMSFFPATCIPDEPDFVQSPIVFVSEVLRLFPSIVPLSSYPTSELLVLGPYLRNIAVSMFFLVGH